MKMDIPDSLRLLSAGLKKIRELLAWDELQRQEARPDTPPSFQFHNHTQEELLPHLGAFVKTAMDLQDFLNSPSPAAPTEQVLQWQQQLWDLEREFRLLDTYERFIKP